MKQTPAADRIRAIIDNNLLEEEIRIDLLSEIADFGYYHFTKEMGKDAAMAKIRKSGISP